MGFEVRLLLPLRIEYAYREEENGYFYFTKWAMEVQNFNIS